MPSGVALMPQSTTMAPGGNSARMSPGTRGHDDQVGALVSATRSRVAVWQTTTVASRASSSEKTGRPTTAERPTITARRPGPGLVLLDDGDDRQGHGGNEAGSPRASRPALVGVAPSTSFSGSMCSTSGVRRLRPRRAGRRRCQRVRVRVQPLDGRNQRVAVDEPRSRRRRSSPPAPGSRVERGRAVMAVADDRKHRRLAVADGLQAARPARAARCAGGPRGLARRAAAPSPRPLDRRGRALPSVEAVEETLQLVDGIVRKASSASSEGRLIWTLSTAPRSAATASSAPTPASLIALRLPIGASRSASQRTCSAKWRSGAARGSPRESRQRPAPRARQLEVGLPRQPPRTDDAVIGERVELDEVEQLGLAVAAAIAIPVSSLSSSGGRAAGGEGHDHAHQPGSHAPARAAALPPPGIGSPVAMRSMSSRAGRSLRRLGSIGSDSPAVSGAAQMSEFGPAGRPG